MHVCAVVTDKSVDQHSKGQFANELIIPYIMKILHTSLGSDGNQYNA